MGGNYLHDKVLNRVEKMKKVFLIIIILSSFTAVFGQKRKIVFPLTIVIYAGIDTIYCFEDSLSENSDLIPINTENDFVGFVNEKLRSIQDIDTNSYMPMIRFHVVSSVEFGNEITAYNRVFQYNSKTKRNIGFWYRKENAEPENYSILKKVIKKRLNK